MSDAAILRGFLSRAARRLVWIAVAEGAAAGLILSVPVILLVSIGAPGAFAASWGTVVAMGFALSGALLRAFVLRRADTAVALSVERNAPACRNLLVTAAEILHEDVRVRPWIGDIVCREAARLVLRLDPARLFPARRTVTILIAAVVLCAAAIANVRAVPVTQAVASTEVEGVPAIEALDVTVIPPEYSGLPEESMRDPVRVEALAGSRIRLRIRARAASVQLETADSQEELVPAQPGAFEIELVADADGYLALEPRTSEGAGERRLIGVSVRADESPGVRVTVPGHDLYLPDATRSLDLTVEADDDLALASLGLRYTRVSGSGEQFTFVDGELPLAFERRDARSWVGRAALRLDTLGLEPGDVLVYRGIARDRRPGAEPVESDAFLVEITAPGAVASEGFAMDDEEDRYALSQQMVILKTERLLARAPSMQQDSILHEARALAAEQRSVRAEFVFMMGGELAEEVEEANIGDLNEEQHVEADDEAIAGRLENQGRFALIRAIRSMSRAFAALNEGELATALIEEKLALDFLQGAFARTRYILRALTEREQIDLERRLTGATENAGRDIRPALALAESEQSGILRATLAGVAALVTGEFSSTDAGRVTMLAEQVLRSDPSSAVLQEIANGLLEAAMALRSGATGQARAQLDRAATALSDRLRAAMPSSPAVRSNPAVDRLDGALTDALRRGSR